MPAALEYTVEIPDPRTHHVHVTLRVPDAGPTTRLYVPRWTPGSYLLREHGRHVDRVQATVEGKAATVEKADPHAWEVRAATGGALKLEWRVYAHELAVRTAHVDDTHAFFNGVNLFMLPEGHETRPCVVDIKPPAGWRVATTLPRRDDGRFTAEDYHHLVDCPVEVGTHRSFTFDVRGVPHEFVLWNHGNEDMERLARDLPRLVEFNASIFGGLPYKRYLFITHLSDGTRGGLEHRDSTALLYPRFGFKPDKDYEEFLTLCAHEHFHTWNVKRIKPRGFAPYDYTRENPTRALWSYEGFTSYYDNFGVRRSGLMTADRYLAVVGELVTQLHNTPGRGEHTLEQASMDAWVKYYRPDENTVNSTVSYYLKGELVALCLDLSIRKHTNGARTLDDVMRLLWTWTQKRGEGLDENATEQAASEVAGTDMKPFFDRAVRSTEELPLAECLAYAGLDLQWRASEGSEDKGGTRGRGGPARAWLGGTLKRDGTIQNVRPGGPLERAGLAPGDQLVAVNGFRAGDNGWSSRLDECTPGQALSVHFFRRDEMRQTTITTGEAPRSVAFIVRREGAPAGEVAIRRAWLGEE